MITHWYLPSWNGDFRLEASGADQATLKIVDATAFEKELLNAFLAKAAKRKWTSRIIDVDHPTMDVVLEAPIAAAGKLLVQMTKSKKKTLSAVVYKNGRITTEESTNDNALAALAAAAAKDDAAKAVTVTRPTPCCPQCQPGANKRASEVLESFLTDEEHEEWSKHRKLTVFGGDTGHEYVIAHRNSKLAARFGRIAYDVDDGGVLHFHDWSVPAEEEVLATKLILENAEPWLRNEATCLGFAQNGWKSIFKNPFGNGSDGRPEAAFMETFGRALGLNSGFAGFDGNESVTYPGWAPGSVAAGVQQAVGVNTQLSPGAIEVLLNGQEVPLQ